MSIFKLDDLSDVDDEVKSQIGKNKITDKMLELFKLKNTLSISEIIVGMVRKFGIKRSRVYVINALYRLSKGGLIKSVGGKRGIYEIGKEVKR